MSLLSLKDLKVAYGANVVLEHLNLTIENGELVSLLGPSGCGKTTTLRTIAGFIQAQDGQFIFNGKDYTRVPVHKRNFGFVFQNYALFPHLTVADNVAFGLKLRKMDAKQIAKQVAEILEIVDLTEYAKRYPKELSGGQRQRVALARALVIKPDLLLFDEPLSNLDAKLRVKMRVEIKKIQQELGITTVYVTHDQEECFSISDKVAIMNEGVIEQMDSPQNIYKLPATEFVARFVGFENFVEFETNPENGLYVSRFGHRFNIQNQNSNGSVASCKGAIRPDEIEILTRGDLPQTNTIEGTIGISTFLGKEYQYVVDTKLGTFVVNSNAETRLTQGETVKLHLPKEKLILV
ncbi:MAG TPA: ABC transporter ATP-binding protein [Bacillota bacterium]|nr:ABC transporter ATP-binding protein [Bacillota bacterium]